MSKRILAFEPDDAVLRLIKLLLSVEDYAVTSQDDQTLKIDADLVLVDITLPYEESLETLGRIRKAETTPVIAISATTDNSVRHAILEAGADDFMGLPFEPDELVSHVRFMLDDHEPVESGRAPLVAGDLEIDFNRRAVRAGGAPISLTYSEWVLLENLAAPPGQPCLMAELLTPVWGPDVKHDHKFLKIWISRLHRKLGCDPMNPRLIRPYHDVGYVLTV